MARFLALPLKIVSVVPDVISMSYGRNVEKNRNREMDDKNFSVWLGEDDPAA